MSVDAERKHGTHEQACGFEPPFSAAWTAGTSRALCDVMLDVLGRDNRLRSTYVRQRWQGLVEETKSSSDDQMRKR